MSRLEIFFDIFITSGNYRKSIESQKLFLQKVYGVCLYYSYQNHNAINCCVASSSLISLHLKASATIFWFIITNFKLADCYFCFSQWITGDFINLFCIESGIVFFETQLLSNLFRVPGSKNILNKREMSFGSVIVSKKMMGNTTTG